MATVYLARRADHGAPAEALAVKVLHDQLARQPDQVARFEREARYLIGIDHRSVVRGLDHGVAGGRHFIVMEHVAGVSLAAVMKACPLSRPERVLLAHLIAEAAEGLHAVHEHGGGLVHLDMSPQNVVVAFDGAVKIVDLGLATPARELERPGGHPLPGKPAYMAPEQHLGQRVDRRADIFALGVVLWEAAVLRRLFEADDDEAAARRVIAHDILPLSHVDPDVPRRLEAIVVRALRADPGARHASGAELASELRSFIAESGEAMDRHAVAEWMTGRFPREIRAARQALDRLLGT
jgi:serine/threonine-protein kinase